MTPVLRVIAGGAPATVQDAGRRGYERYGVPRSGAMDPLALAVANVLVGNAPGATAIEITAGGAAFQALETILVAVAGGDLRPLLDDEPLPLWTSLVLGRGAVLRFAGRSAHGARAYLAVAGGFDVPLLLGSRSTYLPGGWGGLDGRALRAGDELRAVPVRYDPYSLVGRQARTAPALYHNEPALRFVPGPHHELVGGLDWLNGAPYTVGQASNRIGYRLEGPRRPHALTLPSFGVLPGTLQLPPDGNPILLMADAQPTGGYPVVGVVAAADLSMAAQLLPGDTVRFAPVSAAEARDALLLQRRLLAGAVEDDPVRCLLDWAGA